MRPTWDSFFLDLAKLWSMRSTCSRRQVGAVVVKDKIVLGQGYNGVVSGAKHCIDGGCPRGLMGPEVPPGADYNLFPCKALHAEDNAIEAALEAYGKAPLEGATIFVTEEPCQQCLNKIQKYKIGRVVIMGHERGEDQQTTEEPVEHDAPHPSSVESDCE